MVLVPQPGIEPESPAWEDRFLTRASLRMVKNLPAMQETWVQSLGREDLLEKGMATHSSILAWGIPWIEEPGGLQSKGSQRATNTHTETTREVPSLTVF